MIRSDDELHRIRVATLLNALRDGSHVEIINVLSQLDHLDGEAWQCLVGLIRGDEKLAGQFENRFVLSRWAKGKPKHVASTPIGEQFIVHIINEGFAHGKNLKTMVGGLTEELGASRALIMKAWSRYQASLVTKRKSRLNTGSTD